jgi:hypothetical protein
MNVFELFAKLGLDTSEYNEGLEGAEKSASSFGANLKKGIGVAAGVTAAGITAVTGATVAGTKAFVDGVSDVAQYGDRIDKLSQKMNLSAESFQEWDFIMQHAGTSIESMQASIKTLSSAAETGNEAFEKLGLSQEEIANMSGEELFEATITALQNVDDETQRTYLAGQLLGRGATELGALLNMSAEETEEMRNQVHELGGVLSDDAVKNAATFQDSLQNMQTSFTGLKNSMLTEFLPSFSTVMDGLSLVFSGDSEQGLGMIEQGVNDLADNIAEVAPRFIQIGGTILTSLSGAIIDNLPVLLQSGAEVISQIGLGIINNLDTILPAIFGVIEIIGGTLIDHEEEILQAGVNILLMLTNGIAEHADEIAPTIVGVIHTMVSVLTSPDVAVPLIRGGLQIISGLASGLAEATPELVSMIPEIIANIILTIVEVAPDIGMTVLSLLGSLGESILGSIVGLMGMSWDEVGGGLDTIFEGVGQFFSDIFSNIGGFFSDIVSDAGSFISDVWLGISGGLDDIIGSVATFGQDIWDSFIGIFENVKTTVSNAIDNLISMFDFDWSLPQIKLPHFSVSGGFSLDPTNFQLPTISVDWYKKAMDTPYMLEDATIFGASGGKLLGAGEAGSEIVIGTNKLMNMMKQAVGVDTRPITINVYGAEGQNVRELAKEVSKELQILINDKEKAYGLA